MPLWGHAQASMRFRRGSRSEVQRCWPLQAACRRMHHHQQAAHVRPCASACLPWLLPACLPACLGMYPNFTAAAPVPSQSRWPVSGGSRAGRLRDDLRCRRRVSLCAAPPLAPPCSAAWLRFPCLPRPCAHASSCRAALLRAHGCERATLAPPPGFPAATSAAKR